MGGPKKPLYLPQKVRMTTAAYQREYYRTHPETRKKSSLRKKRKQFEYIRWLHDYLVEHPCLDCGETDPIVLEFDHLKQASTNRDVASLGATSREIQLAEIAKCEVVCANCHTRRTAMRANTSRWRINQGLRDESSVT